MHTAASMGPIKFNLLVYCNSENCSVHSGSLAKGLSYTIQCTLVITICHLFSALHITVDSPLHVSWFKMFLYSRLKFNDPNVESPLKVTAPTLTFKPTAPQKKQYVGVSLSCNNLQHSKTILHIANEFQLHKFWGLWSW
jgi:hypothetical protein